MFKKKAIMAINYIQELYKNGLISYPRVDNNFIKVIPMNFFPHKPLPIMSKDFQFIFSPLKKNEYRFDKAFSIVFFNILKILSPASIHKNISYIDQVFTDNMEFKDENWAKKKIEQYDNFIIGLKKMNENDIVEKRVSAYKIKPKIVIYKIKNRIKFSSDERKKKYENVLDDEEYLLKNGIEYYNMTEKNYDFFDLLFYIREMKKQKRKMIEKQNDSNKEAIKI